MAICVPGMPCFENTALPSCPTCNSCISVFPSSCTPECVPVSSDCVYYNGPNLVNSGIETNDDLTTVIEKLNEVISSGGVPLSRTLTINGTSYDLSANRTWTVGDLLSSGSYANPSWVTSLAYSKITGVPAFITLTSLSAGTGISYNNLTGVITNSSPDQNVILTQGAGISISGTYPSFTITSTITQYTDALARLSLSAGTGVSYDNLTGIITNSAPDQTVVLTAGTNISITGTYPNFTINSTGGGGSPAGSNKQIQYNNSGSFGAESGFEYDASTDIMTLSRLSLGGGTITSNTRLYVKGNGTGTQPIAQFVDSSESQKFGFYSNGEFRLNGVAGTSGQLLQSNGSGSLPSWVTLTSGDMILASVQTSTGKKTFQADATNAGINVSTVTVVPSYTVNGDLYYNSTTETLNTKVGGSDRQLIVGSLSNTRIPFMSSSANLLVDDASFTYVSGSSLLSVPNATISTALKNTALTSGRIPYISTGGLFVDSSQFTFSPGAAAGTSLLYIGTNTGNVKGQIQINGNDGTFGDILTLTAQGDGSGAKSTITCSRILVIDHGSGGGGYLQLLNIPTSSAGLPSGGIWNNSGVLSIV